MLPALSRIPHYHFLWVHFILSRSLLIEIISPKGWNSYRKTKVSQHQTPKEWHYVTLSGFDSMNIAFYKNIIPSGFYLNAATT